jgi:hypothetical protein
LFGRVPQVADRLGQPRDFPPMRAILMLSEFAGLSLRRALSESLALPCREFSGSRGVHCQKSKRRPGRPLAVQDPSKIPCAFRAKFQMMEQSLQILDLQVIGSD